jgi:triacylglycerol esterase/lipase EstA (alpha/beta hydrolase family)
MKKIVFIPGLLGGPRDLWVIRPMFKNFEIIPFYYNTTLKEPVEKIAKQLDKFINNLNLKKGEKISIIGLSAGGVIADYYLKYINNKRVDKFVSICSPFKGSYLAHLTKIANHKNYRLNSKFLTELSKKKLKNVKVKNIWCFFDYLVPGTSGKGTNPQHTYFFFHPFIEYWPPIILDIKKFLER